MVWAVVKVIPLLPPASPEPPAAADRSQPPAPVISWKSALEAETAAAVRLTAVPGTLTITNKRLTAEFPAKVSVPVMVWLAEKATLSVLAAVPVRVRAVKVFAPATVCAVLFNRTPL